MGLLNIQGRHFKFHCVNRVYDANNHTFWSDQLYGAEVWTFFLQFPTYSFPGFSCIIPSLCVLEYVWQRSGDIDSPVWEPLGKWASNNQWEWSRFLLCACIECLCHYTSRCCSTYGYSGNLTTSFHPFPFHPFFVVNNVNLIRSMWTRTDKQSEIS